MRRGGAGTAAVLLAAVLFGAALLISLLTGVGVYRQIQTRTETASGERLGMAYVSAKVHAHDAAGAVLAGSFGGGDALYLLQDLDGLEYETILYVHDGWLMELFCERGWELKPEAGQQITPAGALTVREDGGLLSLALADTEGRTQQAEIYLRSH